MVRCGIKVGPQWTKASFNATQAGMTKTQPIELDGDLLTFEVFPSEDSVDVTIAADTSGSTWTSKVAARWWTLTGCDRTVS